MKACLKSPGFRVWIHFATRFSVGVLGSVLLVAFLNFLGKHFLSYVLVLPSVSDGVSPGFHGRLVAIDDASMEAKPEHFHGIISTSQHPRSSTSVVQRSEGRICISIGAKKVRPLASSAWVPVLKAIWQGGNSTSTS